MKAEAKSWRDDCARIVEELFSVTAPEHWDMLLELREQLLEGKDWAAALDLFLGCREKLETEHYLPFYRLRRLISESLALEVASGQEHVGTLEQILRRKHRSLADIERAVTREVFEHDLGASRPVALRVVER